MTKVFCKIICEKRDFLCPFAYNNYKSLLLAREHESKGQAHCFVGVNQCACPYTHVLMGILQAVDILFCQSCGF